MDYQTYNEILWWKLADLRQEILAALQKLAGHGSNSALWARARKHDGSRGQCKLKNDFDNDEILRNISTYFL